MRFLWALLKGVVKGPVLLALAVLSTPLLLLGFLAMVGGDDRLLNFADRWITSIFERLLHGL